MGDTLVGPATYTLDAAATDRWRHFDFERSAVVRLGPWDVAFRRFHVITGPGGGMVDLGMVPFDSVVELPEAGLRTQPRGRGLDQSRRGEVV